MWKTKLSNILQKIKTDKSFKNKIRKLKNSYFMLMWRSMACCWCSYNSMGYSDTSERPKLTPFSSRLCCSSTSFRMLLTLLSLLPWSVWNMYFGNELSKWEFIIASLCVCFKDVAFSVKGSLNTPLTSNWSFSSLWWPFLLASLVSSSESHETI